MIMYKLLVFLDFLTNFCRLLRNFLGFRGLGGGGAGGAAGAGVKEALDVILTNQKVAVVKDMNT